MQACRRARSAQAGVRGRASEGVGGSWALGERAHCRRAGLPRRAAGGHWVGARQGRGSSAQGAQATSRRNSSKHGVGAQERAAEHTVRARHGRPGRWMGAQAGPVLMHCAPG